MKKLETSPWNLNNFMKIITKKDSKFLKLNKNYNIYPDITMKSLLTNVISITMDNLMIVNFMIVPKLLKMFTEMLGADN